MKSLRENQSFTISEKCGNYDFLKIFYLKLDKNLNYLFLCHQAASELIAASDLRQLSGHICAGKSFVYFLSHASAQSVSQMEGGQAVRKQNFNFCVKRTLASFVSSRTYKRSLMQKSEQRQYKNTGENSRQFWWPQNK